MKQLFFDKESPTHVRIGRARLPRARDAVSDLVPSADAVCLTCVDQTTAETLEFLAWAILLGEPVLLEGPPATSKLSCVEMLASALGQPMVRIKLHGLSNPGDLVGRREVADSEGSGACRYGWRDGLVVRAMAQGWWVVLDGLNLAEPHVLERIHPVLDQQPRLVLVEHDGRTIDGASVHPGFRVFGTMNPTEYPGRVSMSPAFVDRWTAFRRVPLPTEEDLVSNMRFWLLGEQPDVTVRGVRYRGVTADAVFGDLAQIPGTVDALLQLARFHAAYARATSTAADAIGLASYDDPHAQPSRRLLLRAVQFVERLQPSTKDQAASAVHEAFDRYYVPQCGSDARREEVAVLAEALGVRPSAQRKKVHR